MQRPKVAAWGSLAPQFAHFDDNVATHKAAELWKKAPLTTSEQIDKRFLTAISFHRGRRASIQAQIRRWRRWP